MLAISTQRVVQLGTGVLKGGPGEKVVAPFYRSPLLSVESSYINENRKRHTTNDVLPTT